MAFWKSGEGYKKEDGELDTSWLGKAASSLFNFGPLGKINAGDFASLAGKPIGGLLSQGMSSTAGSIMGGAADIVSQIPGPVGMFGGAALNVASGITNALFGSKENTANIQAANAGTSSLLNFNSNVGSFDEIKGPISVNNFSKSDLGRDGLFSNHIGKMYDRMQKERAFALDLADRSVANNIAELQEKLNRDLLANFAALGGFLSNGILNWDTDLVSIGTGGTHELNPNEGIQVGIDPEGTPNLVEEGEVIWNNEYVFSNRLKIPKRLLKKYGMTGKRKMSFADLASKFKTREDERPNDVITRRTVNKQLQMLQEDLEEKRNIIALKEQQARRESLESLYSLYGFTQQYEQQQEQYYQPY